MLNMVGGWAGAWNSLFGASLGADIQHCATNFQAILIQVCQTLLEYIKNQYVAFTLTLSLLHFGHVTLLAGAWPL